MRWTCCCFKKVVQHPGAERLKLVEVGIGDQEYRIVCGAANVRGGMKVAMAQIGAVLPGGERIAAVKLRGEVSEGMLCSERELGVGMDHAGILEVSSNVAVGTRLSEVYPSDAVIDLKTPANRWDLQGVYGLAREVAAMTGETLAVMAPPPVEFSGAAGVLADELQALRYTLTRITVKLGAHSPSQVVARLRSAGVRSISPVVDITNYVMLETGQPLHAFDAAKVTLPISVRVARQGETLVTLDGVERKLHTPDLIIADAKGPIALAGLMGGKTTEVGAETTEILLEAAVFDGVQVRKTAQRHGLRTEASARFERGLPVTLPPLAVGRAVELLKKLAGGKLAAAYETGYVTPKLWSIALPISSLSKILGIVITHKEAVAALNKLGIEVASEALVKMHKDGDKEPMITVLEVPWWRPDLKEPADLVEEIVRVIGYDRIPATIPSWRPTKITFDRERAVRRRVRDIAWAAGAFEVMTYSFVAAQQLEKLGLEVGQHLKLKNPLSSEQAYLRSSLLPSHLATLERNRMYSKSMRFYELSRVFLRLIITAPSEDPSNPAKLLRTRPDFPLAHSSPKWVLVWR